MYLFEFVDENIFEFKLPSENKSVHKHFKA